ncbi:hypothetical protein OMP43_03965 [Sphingomonas sp. CBMAI 2297]|uniref:hypothetical protein n=1 Tax=Sphingomonas sp. CBMAI 2297 TaxID=2991720 RepID=UPI002457897E|nr:hypothetical protein [Sphingomonas sp. CBMAI 2297]MDH4743169.1 hypothetical protein [Sphingomonas sp. CBMAI 2297]
MGRSIDSAIAATDWLAQRWDFAIRNVGLIACGEPWYVEAGGCTVSSHATELDADAWIAGFKILSIADVVLRHARLGPRVIIIEGMSGRLARIPTALAVAAARRKRKRRRLRLGSLEQRTCFAPTPLEMWLMP